MVETLLPLFNIKSKKELVRYCREIIIGREDLVHLILAGQAGILSPYKYASHFHKRIPVHLTPLREEIEAISHAKKRPLEGKARKLTRKMFQLMMDKRNLSAHLFYTATYDYWQLFYFDQRDQERRGNHWIRGLHLHFVNDVRLPNVPLDEIWSKVQKGDTTFPSTHIRYLLFDT